MCDHIETARKLQIEIYRQMTPARKLEISMSMYWGARRLKAAALRQFNPDWSEEHVQAKVKELFANARP